MTVCQQYHFYHWYARKTQCKRGPLPSVLWKQRRGQKMVRYQGPPSQEGKLNCFQHHRHPCSIPNASPVAQIKSHKLSPTFSDVEAVSTSQPTLSMPSMCKIQNVPILKSNYTQNMSFSITVRGVESPSDCSLLREVWQIM